MSTLRYGIACSYFTFVLNAIITVMMFSVFLRIFNTFIPDFILQMFDPVTEWILDLNILDFDMFWSHVVYRNLDIHSLLLNIAAFLFLISLFVIISGLSNYNRLRKAAVCGFIGSIIVYSEFRYCGNVTFAIIVLALFFNISVIMSIPKITNALVSNARQGILDSGDLEFGTRDASSSKIKKDARSISKVQNKMDRLGEKMFEERTVGCECKEAKSSKIDRNDDGADESINEEAVTDASVSDSVETEVEQTPDAGEVAKEDSGEHADVKKSRKGRQKKPHDRKRK